MKKMKREVERGWATARAAKTKKKKNAGERLRPFVGPFHQRLQFYHAHAGCATLVLNAAMGELAVEIGGGIGRRLSFAPPNGI
jgi:hypothetical protein